MFFILTCSEDSTTDLLLPYLKEIDVFRFNIDRFMDFRWDFSGNGFSIAHVNGHSITSETITAFYLRKPVFFERIEIPKEGSLINWVREEITELLKDLYYTMAAQGRCALIHPGNGRWGKPRQMSFASALFKVPEWHIFHGNFSGNRKKWVVKTLTQTPVGENKTLFVREVSPSCLNPDYPWFIQEKIEAEEDVTVVYVKGRCFAFSLDRPSFKGEDCRLEEAFDRLPWRKIDLQPNEESRIRKFMYTTGLDFGRLDFLRKDGELWFLELNPNGQWAWLDEDNRHGLLSAVADELIKADGVKRISLIT